MKWRLSIDSTYSAGSTLPGLRFPWLLSDGTPLDLTTGWTLGATLVARRNGTEISVTGTVQGQAGAVAIGWSASDLDLPPGTSYDLLVTATEIATGRVRVLRPRRLPRVYIT